MNIWFILALIAVLGVNNSICAVIGVLAYRLGRVEGDTVPAAPTAFPVIVDREKTEVQRRLTKAERKAAEFEKNLKAFEEELMA